LRPLNGNKGVISDLLDKGCLRSWEDGSNIGNRKKGITRGGNRGNPGRTKRTTAGSPVEGKNTFAGGPLGGTGVRRSQRVPKREGEVVRVVGISRGIFESETSPFDTGKLKEKDSTLRGEMGLEIHRQIGVDGRGLKRERLKGSMSNPGRAYPLIGSEKFTDDLDRKKVPESCGPALQKGRGCRLYGKLKVAYPTEMDWTYLKW